MVIRVLDHVQHCYTWADGSKIGQVISTELSQGRRLVLSFRGVDDVPSSFVNAAFVELLNEFSYDTIRRQLSVVESSRQINDMIKRRLEFEANRRSDALADSVGCPKSSTSLGSPQPQLPDSGIAHSD